jgi:phosphatidylglycerophosphate synthase
LTERLSPEAAMLDGWARRAIDPAIDRIAGHLARAGIGANVVSVAACAVGLAAAGAIALGHVLAGLVLILLSRLGDGLDGAVARRRGATDLGGYLDIVLDFVFYGAVPLGFVLLDPQANGVAGAVLLFSFYVNGASFLAFATMAAKRGIETTRRGAKSFYFTTGLAEATETLAAFCLMCLAPSWFAAIAYVFAAMTLYTALARIILAARSLR